MKRSPYDVQLAALNASRGHTGFAYFMEQGLGKSGTLILDFLNLVAEGKLHRLVIVSPPSFKGGWVDEIEEWGFDVEPFVYQAGNDGMNDAFLKRKFTKPPVLIINYESLRPKVVKVGGRNTYVWSNGMNFVQQFTEGRKWMLGVDESVQIATFDAAQTVGVMLLAEKSQYQRLLSGKPQRKGPHDLWSQYRTIGHMFMGYFQFKNSFCQTGGFKGKQIIGSMNEGHLAELIDPFTFRATKADWTDLPPKVYMPPQEYELTKEMAGMYKSMHDDFVLWLNEEEYVTVDAAITKYIKLAQIQAGFVFDAEKKVRVLVDPKKNPRMSLLENLLSDSIPGKAVVVYSHKPVRAMLLEKFEKLRPVFIHGGMTDEEISANKKTFNNDRDCRIICITKAAKYGHTLLGDQSTPDHACADMVFFENTYNSDDRSQLEDRSHRHGQKQDSMRYWDMFGTPLDKMMIQALQRNENVFRAVFSKLRKTGR